MKRLKVLLVAYACRPDKGSEPGVGWNMARELAKHHDVWVLTRQNNASAIDSFLTQTPVAGLQVVYCDLPPVLRWWKYERWEVHLHYALWQLSAYFVARRLHHHIQFDLAHHATYSRYCNPSFLTFLPIPMILGPVGGGESAPTSFWQDYGLRGQLYELLREGSRWLGEQDPLVWLTARRSRAVLVSTHETASRMKALGAKRIETIAGQTGINQQELAQLGLLAHPVSDRPVRFLSLGRLLHWKGFHLGLRAFAQANLPHAEYWIVGEGKELGNLEALVQELGIGDRVRFWGNLPRDQALSVLGECDVLVHPSLHDFSPTVCLEAMAAGKPVLCLNIGGPAVQITETTGIRVAAETPEQAVQDLAKAMIQLASTPELRCQMGEAGQQRVKEFYGWEAKGQILAQLYQQVICQTV
ncbi:MAG TPA: glycosyltransferase family 4 protein [Allocoleopsis sp.]